MFQTVPQIFYSFALDQDNQLDMSSIGVSSRDSSLIGSVDAEWIGPEQQVTNLLKESFKEVPEVKSICAQFDADGITIWTLLASYDREARQRVYEKELKICELLGIYDFDFRVTSIDLVSPADLVGAGSVEIFKRL